jgi:heat shock protein HslJ
MRALLALLLTVIPTMPQAQGLTGTDWQLVAIDGVAFPASASLRIDADGTLHGRAPCNSFGAANQAELPQLRLGAIRATRMACPRLAEEEAFFAALSAMTTARQDDSGRLLLTGPGGRTMEFAAG